MDQLQYEKTSEVTKKNSRPEIAVERQLPGRRGGECGKYSRSEIEVQRQSTFADGDCKAKPSRSEIAVQRQHERRAGEGEPQHSC